MAYDPVSGSTLRFRGPAGGAVLPGIHYGDTRTYAGVAWSDITPTTCSSATCPRADESGRRSLYQKNHTEHLVLLGGRTGNGLLDSTWIFSGNWNNVTPTVPVSYSNSPPPLNSGSMTWDAKDGFDLLYGACSFGCERRSLSAYESWAFEGPNAPGTAISKNLTAPVDASSLFSEALTYDAQDGYVRLYGGQRPGTTSSQNPTRSFPSSTGWMNRTVAKLSPENTPPFVGIIPGQLEYDPAKTYVRLFGASTSGRTPTAGTKPRTRP
jgi:hypothetical protein